MFKKLFDRIRPGESTHPLGSTEGITAIINEFPLADEHRLLEANEWLSSLPEQLPTLGFWGTLKALSMFDSATHEARYALLDRYFKSGTHDHVSNSMLDALVTHLDFLLQAYVILIGFKPGKQEELQDKQRGYLTRAGARNLRIWTLQKRIAHFRYRSAPTGAWRQVHDLLATMGHLGVLQSPVSLYEAEEKSSPFREYLLGVYFELAPLGNLDPAQQELLGRFLDAQASFECAAQPGVLATHCIDLVGNSGPQAYVEGAVFPGSSVMRYVSYARLRPALLKLEAAVRQNRDLPSWLTALAITPNQMSAGVQALLIHWAPKPPTRLNQRDAASEQLRVAFGFAMARRFVAATQFARSGRSLRYDIVDPDEMYKAYNLGAAKPEDEAAGEEAAPEVIDPMETLKKLELAGDRAMMEMWTQVDVSATGIGVMAPALLPRHVIGALVALRPIDGLEWQLGLIRRIGRDEQGKPNFGLEMLGGPSLSAMIKMAAGENGRWAMELDDGHGWTDAVLVREDHDELVVPAGAYIENLAVDIRSELGLQRIRLTGLIERGTDFERVRFAYI